MSDTRIFVGSMVAGLAVLGVAAFMYTSSNQALASTEDGPGPNLVIQVEGAATSGTVVIDLLPDTAPKHVAQITELARMGAYDNVVFHRVIDGFMAQTGDVKNGKWGHDISMAGTGGSDLPDIPAEFTDEPFMRGTVGMARSRQPDSANSQFFIMFAPADHLNGQYTIVGHVISGMEVIDALKKGSPDLNGAVDDPDRMVRVTVDQ
ncbi:MAG: peptidylprolyl isomerase [Rhodobacteraceae bacterium]|nr:peptidylprolyl isomerase [Paracoccaceae bacterium]